MIKGYCDWCEEELNIDCCDTYTKVSVSEFAGDRVDLLCINCEKRIRKLRREIRKQK